QKFTTRNAMPDGFTPVDFDITYDCGDTSKIKNSLQMRIDGTTGVVDQYNLVARRRSSDNVPDVGIRIENLVANRLHSGFEKTYGDFLEFETLTLCPIHLDCIVV
uniref:fimbrial protein n=1 Tax=Stenotrophomonas maltophilia TaxID=40324 RepID=UPI001C12F753